MPVDRHLQGGVVTPLVHGVPQHAVLVEDAVLPGAVALVDVGGCAHNAQQASQN